MTALFQRHVRLDVTESLDGSIERFSINRNHTDQLQIDFDIEQRASATPLDGRITVFNLSNTNEDRIRKRGLYIVLYAGYVGGRFGVIAECDIQRIDRNRLTYASRSSVRTNTRWQALNRSTNFDVSGNAIQNSDAVVKVSIDGTRRLQAIVKEIITKAMRPVVKEDGSESTEFESAGMKIDDSELRLLRGISIDEDSYKFEGRAVDALSDLLDTRGITWYSDGDSIRLFVPKDLRNSDVIVIGPDTGMVGSPSITDEGIRVTTLIDHRIRIGKTIEVESRVEEASGKYTVTRIRHRGNNRHGQFHTVIEATSPEVDETQST